MSEHVAGLWCADLHCTYCYAPDTWQLSEIASLRARVAELERVDDAWAVTQFVVRPTTARVFVKQLEELHARVAELERERDKAETERDQADRRAASMGRERDRFDPVRRALELRAEIGPHEMYGWYCVIGSVFAYGVTPEAACAAHPALKETT